MNNEIETKLISDYLNGNEDAFRELVSLYLKPIYSFSVRLTGSKNDSEDITQEIFLKIWKNIKKYDEKQSFRAWIFTIARNTIFDWLRKKKELIFSDFEDHDGENYLVDNLKDESDDPEDLFITRENIEFVKKIIEKLSKADQEIIYLKHDEDLTFDEISKVVKKPLNTVKSQYRRALQKLKKLATDAPKSPLFT